MLVQITAGVIAGAQERAGGGFTLNDAARIIVDKVALTESVSRQKVDSLMFAAQVAEALGLPSAQRLGIVQAVLRMEAAQ